MPNKGKIAEFPKENEMAKLRFLLFPTFFFFFPTPHEKKKKLNDWLVRRSREPTWASSLNPDLPPYERPSCEWAWRNVDRRRYTTSGHHLVPDAILVFRLGYSCGNDQEGPLSVKRG